MSNEIKCDLRTGCFFFLRFEVNFSLCEGDFQRKNFVFRRRWPHEEISFQPQAGQNLGQRPGLAGMPGQDTPFISSGRPASAGT
jgi:hypothetical protein